MKDKDKLIAELKALVSQRDTSVTAQTKIILELKAENERLKEEFRKKCEDSANNFIEIQRLKEELATYGATGVCEVCSDKANKLADKYLGCLQEIKAIAEENKDTVQYGKICRSILMEITKAESEG